MQEVQLTPCQLASGRTICGIICIGLHALHVTHMLDLVDGTKAVIAGVGAGREEAARERGCDRGGVSHLCKSQQR